MSPPHSSQRQQELDIAVIGAGFSGLQVLLQAVQGGRRARLFEAGSSVGGTWHWNRYPGTRVDVESLIYSFSFSRELEQDWNWSERYAAQPELLAYIEHVVDRFDLRPHIQLNSFIESASFDEQLHRWELRTGSGEHVHARHCAFATGLLHAPKRVQIPGIETFEGKTAYTGQWPENLEIKGRRVAVIGTGSSGVQTIAEVGRVAERLTVLQRTPSYVVPARNHKLGPEYQESFKARYAEIRARQYESMAGIFALTFLDQPHPTHNAMEVSASERKARYYACWEAGGLSFYTAFLDLLFDPAANESCAEYVRRKIREQIDDPKTADKLTPNYPILARRLCAGNGYYETFNRPNVELIDLNEFPIARATANGIVVGEREIECDLIIFATGFDALSGALERIDIRGRGGQSLRDHWKKGVRSYAGLLNAGYPNLFMINGPMSPSAFWSPIQIAQYQAAWILRCLDHLDAQGLDCVEALPEHEAEWVAAVRALAEPTLLSQVPSWYRGDNIPGKAREVPVYLGGYSEYVAECERAAADGFAKLQLSRADRPNFSKVADQA